MIRKAEQEAEDNLSVKLSTDSEGPEVKSPLNLDLNSAQNQPPNAKKLSRAIASAANQSQAVASLDNNTVDTLQTAGG